MLHPSEQSPLSFEPGALVPPSPSPDHQVYAQNVRVIPRPDSIAEVSDAAREQNPSTWVPGAARATTANGLPKRNRNIDVFDKERLGVAEPAPTAAITEERPAHSYLVFDPAVAVARNAKLAARSATAPSPARPTAITYTVEGTTDKRNVEVTPAPSRAERLRRTGGAAGLAGAIAARRAASTAGTSERVVTKIADPEPTATATETAIGIAPFKARRNASMKVPGVASVQNKPSSEKGTGSSVSDPMHTRTAPVAATKVPSQPKHRATNRPGGLSTAQANTAPGLGRHRAPSSAIVTNLRNLKNKLLHR